MEKFADNCGWAGHSPKISGGWACKKRKWLLLPADKGTGLCPCRYWVERLEKNPKKADFPPKTLF